MREASRVWWATQQLRRGRHDVASYTSAAKVRTHIGALRAAGWTSSAIARAAGVSQGTISRVRKRGTRWCSRIVALAVLGVEP